MNRRVAGQSGERWDEALKAEMAAAATDLALAMLKASDDLSAQLNACLEHRTPRDHEMKIKRRRKKVRAVRKARKVAQWRRG